MPLGSSNDSFVDLKTLAESSPHLVDATKPPQSTTTPSSGGDGPTADSSPSWDKQQWWEPGHEVSQYEHDFVEPKNHKRESDTCFACFLAPWFGRGENDDETDSEDEEEQVNTLDESLSQHSSYHGGILKRSSVMVQVTPGVGSSKRSSYHPSEYIPDDTRRSSKLSTRVRFTKPIGKVVDIQPFYTMTPEERAGIWWQQSDFDTFKRELHLLTKSKQLGGCELWLGNAMDEIEFDPKWWHKFGHSRRGLERFLSEEQQQVEFCKRLAVQKVLEEQRRQRKNKEKDKGIAQVYQDYSAWSRDLALAAAASDADAVASGFDDESRKTREYYLVKQAVLSGGNLHKHTPPFMVPVGLEKKPPSAYREVKNKRPSHQLDRSLSKKAAGFGTGENVGTLMTAANEMTRVEG